MASPRFYTYILFSRRLRRFYYGYTTDLRKRFAEHEAGNVTATRSGRPWRLEWYGAFSLAREAKQFETYLKSGSGKAFAYKRLVSGAVAKDAETP